jgi:regulator of protease activity HflC (stomatin/prohibitin superfamily)
VTAVCQAGPTGDRRLTIDSPVGGKITTREGSDDFSVNQNDGPVQAKLPNNGMLFIQLNSGERILVSSRWKVNDPETNIVLAEVDDPAATVQQLAEQGIGAVIAAGRVRFVTHRDVDASDIETVLERLTGRGPA